MKTSMAEANQTLAIHSAFGESVLATLGPTLFIIAGLLTCAPLEAQSLNILHTFAHNTLGYNPMSGLIFGASGELYGTVPFGGANGLGLAYELAPPDSPSEMWTELVVHSFSTKNGDGSPAAALLLGPNGPLYGVTSYNNIVNDNGTVFEIKSPSGTRSHWRENVLHAFTGTSGEGAGPNASLIFGSQHSLYGTTYSGGSSSPQALGTVFKLTPPASDGGPWSEQIVHSFPGYSGDGANPVGPLTLGSGGVLYGATAAGAISNYGAIFQLTPPVAQHGTWVEKLLYSFTGLNGDGYAPNAGVTLGPNGVLYGTTRYGGQYTTLDCTDGRGCGTVFQLTPPAVGGGAWTETILHTFEGFASGDGSQPNSSLVLGPNGVLYGTTRTGGGVGTAPGYGTIFEMVPPPSPGGSWSENVLYSFTGGNDGNTPNAVTLGTDGNLYGTTISGGTHKVGVVFQFVLQ